MVWTTPTPRTTGELITASIWNTDLKDNLLLLKTSIANDGTLNSTGGIIRRPLLFQYLEGLLPHNVSDFAGGNVIIDLTYPEHYLVLNVPIASFSFINSPWASGYFVNFGLTLTYPDNTPRTITWGGTGISIRWSGGAAFVPTCLAGFFDFLTFRTFDNVTWWPAVYGQRM